MLLDNRHGHGKANQFQKAVIESSKGITLNEFITLLDMDHHDGKDHPCDHNPKASEISPDNNALLEDNLDRYVHFCSEKRENVA